MAWEYRVLLKNGAFAIHEVYYAENGEIEFWTENPVQPGGESLSELKRDLEFYRIALRKPVLRYDQDKNVLAELELLP